MKCGKIRYMSQIKYIFVKKEEAIASSCLNVATGLLLPEIEAFVVEFSEIK